MLQPYVFSASCVRGRFAWEKKRAVHIPTHLRGKGTSDISNALSHSALELLGHGMQWRSAVLAQVAPLASLVRNLRLEVYSLKREEKEVEALLDLLSDLAVKLRHPGAIKECLASLHYCASEGPDPLKVL